MSPAAQPANGHSSEPMVRFEGVTKRYGALTVLDNLNLEVGRGEKVAIIGPSGSGKTTVLRMLMTLERINGGVIFLLFSLIAAGLIKLVERWLGRRIMHS